jgi:hypothetical protein
MRRAIGIPALVAVVAAVGMAGTLVARASGWTLADGRTTVSTRVVKMPRGVTPSTAKQSAQAMVSWSAQDITADVKMDHYVVTAHNADNSPRPDISHTVEASGDAVESLTFAAGEVAGGRWYWTIVPKFRQWTGAESAKSQRLTFPAAQAIAPSQAPAAALSTPTPPAPAVSPQGTPTAEPTTTGGTPMATEGTPVDIPPLAESSTPFPPPPTESLAPPTSAPAGE